MSRLVRVLWAFFDDPDDAAAPFPGLAGVSTTEAVTLELLGNSVVLTGNLDVFVLVTSSSVSTGILANFATVSVGDGALEVSMQAVLTDIVGEPGVLVASFDVLPETSGSSVNVEVP